MQGPYILYNPLYDTPAKPQRVSTIWTLSGPAIPSTIMIRQEFHEIILGLLQWMQYQMGSDTGPEPEVKLSQEESDEDDLSHWLDEAPGPGDLGVVSAPSLSGLHEYPNPFLGQRGVTTSSGVVLTGLPGIGKSYFLRIVLHLRSAAGLPTLYISHSPTAALLWKGGKGYNMNISNMDDAVFRQLLPTDTWCLVDIASVPVPVLESRRFIMQAGVGCMEWMTKVADSRYFVMKPWSCGELISARQCQDSKRRVPDETQLARFHHLYGGSARDAYSFAHRLADFEARLGHAFDRLQPDAIMRLCSSGEPSSFVPDSTSPLILSFFPVSSRKRTVWKVDSPSTCLLDRLFIHIGKDYAEGQKKWFHYNRAAHSPGPRALAAYMFDENYHQRIVKHGCWTLRRMVANETRPCSTTQSWRIAEDAPPKFLVACKEISIEDNTPPSTPTVSVPQRTFLDWPVDEPFLVGVYYHPQRRTCTTFDSFFVDKVGHAIVFQANIARNVSPAWLEERGISKATYVYISPTPGPAEVSLPLEVNSDLDGFYDGVYHMDLNYGTVASSD